MLENAVKKGVNISLLTETRCKEYLLNGAEEADSNLNEACASLRKKLRIYQPKLSGKGGVATV